MPFEIRFYDIKFSDYFTQPKPKLKIQQHPTSNRIEIFLFLCFVILESLVSCIKEDDDDERPFHSVVERKKENSRKFFVAKKKGKEMNKLNIKLTNY